MAVRAAAWRPGVVARQSRRPHRTLFVPALALLAAIVPVWLGHENALPRPLARELRLSVISEQQRPVAHEAADTPIRLPLPLPLPPAVDEAPPPALLRPRPRPMLAVVGVGLQGLTLRSEPAGGEAIRLVAEGTDLRDLGEEREAGGRAWKRVAHPDGPEGWVAAQFLQPWDGVDRAARTVAMLARTAGFAPDAERDRAWLALPPGQRSITPDQLKDGQALSTWESYSACGPAATVAFARAVGHDLTLDQAVAAARLVGWHPAVGMPGPRAELALLASLGVPAHQRGGDSEDTIDWDRVIGDVQAGLPVMIVTPRHYFVAEAYDEATGKFDFGNSATVLAAARKQRWFAPHQVAWLGFGAPFTTIHLGDPPEPSEYLRTSSSVAY